jgi:hypothetical protein
VARRTAVKGTVRSTGKGTAKQREGINPRQPCPCGSGRRYKACHGAAGGPADVVVARPYEGLAAECELVALREFVPSATAVLPLLGSGDKEITLATVLPVASAGLVRSDGVAFVGLQVQTRSGDIGRDLARSIEWAREADAGDVLTVVEQSEDQENAVRLTDVIDPKADLEPELHTDFAWWMPADADEPTGEVAVSLERANQAILPTDRLTGVRAAYWVDAGERAHLRWVRPEPEEDLLSGMARLSARGELDLGEGSRFAGSFRAHGLLVPVWDLDREMHAREWDGPATALDARLTEAIASLAAEPVTEAELRARDGLRGRQVTLR